MIKLHDEGIFLKDGQLRTTGEDLPEVALGKIHTMAAKILYFHSRSGDINDLTLAFDALVSHDITYVGIIQTARASGLESFPVPYALTNCHNSLCAVGGTINGDDHAFGLSAAKKYGGIYVPENLAVIHMYAREQLATCGNMILGSDSHTRYGALGTLGVGEGGPELVKQLLGGTYDISAPEVVLVYVTGKPKPGVGPHDVALSLISAVFKNGFVKNKILEFVGPGIKNLSVDFRCAVDVMTTETTCLSSIWETDEQVQAYYEAHDREYAYEELHPEEPAYYDSWIELNLDEVESMIALPFHPSKAISIHEFNANPEKYLKEAEEAAKESGMEISLMDKIHDGGVWADQGVIAGCAGGLFDNIAAAAKILEGESCGNDFFSLSVYPGSQPVNLALMKNGLLEPLMKAGAVVKPCFCGPCFGAGEVPKNNGLSIRHTTRNFPNREGSKPGEGQSAAVALMDARSIAATARMGGKITAATDLEFEEPSIPYTFDDSIYQNRVYKGFPCPQPETELVMGPNIADWPRFSALPEDLLVELAAVIHDPVTTTDELIPSGETSSYRSNPERLSQFALSRRVPDYVPRSKTIRALEAERAKGNAPERIKTLLAAFGAEDRMDHIAFGSAIYANKPGDGSAREQAASCQRVLGGMANLAKEYATKRYRSNLINWGILPFVVEGCTAESGDAIYIPGIRKALEEGQEVIPAKLLSGGKVTELTLGLGALTDREKQILLSGCLMNDYANGN